MKRSIAIITLVLAVLALPLNAGALERQRCFAETNPCVRGAILDYWERNGGLASFSDS